MSAVAIDAALYDSIDGPLTYKEFLRVRSAIIEECARVADEMADPRSDKFYAFAAGEVARRIRALKDKP